MPGSRNKPPAVRIAPAALIVFGVFGLLTVWGAPLAAQEAVGGPARLGAPRRLVPAPQVPAQPPPVSSAPAPLPAPPPPSSGGVKTEPQEKPGDGIQAQILAPVSGDWAGSLGPDKGGLPATLWRGTPRSLVAALLPGLRPSQSPGIRNLVRRLLLSNAAAPAGAAGEGAAGFFEQRVALLIASGQFEAAGTLLDLASNAANDEGLARARVELGFLGYEGQDTKTTCARVADGVRRFQGVFWQRALVTCQAISGDQAQAALGLDLLREQKVPRDEMFDRLVEQLAGGERKRRFERLAGELSPLHFALMEAAETMPPADFLAGTTPPLARAWAASRHVGAAERLVAAERAAAYGALPAVRLAEAYAAAEAGGEDRSNGNGERAARAHAALFRAARDGTTPQARAEALQALLADARRSGDPMIALELAAPLLAETRPAGDLAMLGGVAARAYLAADDRPRANGWWAVTDPKGARAMMLLARLAPRQSPAQGGAPAAGDAIPFDAKLLGDGLAESAAAQGEEALRRGNLAFALLDALGEPISPEQWAVLAGRGGGMSTDLPEAPVWFDLPRAAGARRLGETVLLAVLTLNEGDRLTAQPARLYAALAALRAVGLENEARGLALEAAIGAGL